MTTIHPLAPADHAEWLSLWHQYLVFYEESLDDAVSQRTFARVTAEDPTINGAIARADDGKAIGIVHWLTQASTWSDRPSCYLEDLFVDPAARGSGAGRALIAHVREWAESHGADKVYWLTQSDNHSARGLYDRVAESTGFVHYEIPLA